MYVDLICVCGPVNFINDRKLSSLVDYNIDVYHWTVFDKLGQSQQDQWLSIDREFSKRKAIWRLYKELLKKHD